MVSRLTVHDLMRFGAGEIHLELFAVAPQAGDPRELLARFVEDLFRDPPRALDPAWARLAPPGLQVQTVIVGRHFGLQFFFPRHLRLLEALYRLEAGEQERLPPVLLIPFVLQALAEGLRIPWERAVPVMALLLSRCSPRRFGRMSRPERQLAARELLRALWPAETLPQALEICGETGAGGVEAVRILLELGAWVWNPEAIPADPPGVGGFWVILHLATMAKGEGRDRFPWPIVDWALWYDLVMARRADRPPPPADWPPPALDYRLGLRPNPLWEEETARSLALGLAQALTRVAEAEARYVPAGRFRIRAPELDFLRRAGVNAIRVAADPHGLWVRMVGDQGDGETFRFEPHRAPRPDLAITAPEWWAVAAALWHDLRVGIPRKRSGPSASSASPEPRPASAAEREPVARLPRPFVVQAGKAEEPEPEADWGSPEERVQGVRAVHTVRGHLRRLREGWRASPEAQAIAAAFGVVIPEGFTFVRPHTRGGKGLEAPREAEAVARGLRSLALLER